MESIREMFCLAAVSSCGIFISSVVLAEPVASSPENGRTLFVQRCAMCHSVSADGRSGIGPNLSEVAGRQVAAIEFNYSSAMRNSDIQWDSETLDRFLLQPGQVIPGTMMVVSVPDTQDRDDIVAYLMTLK